MITLSAPADAAKIKAGDQFTVDIPGLGPMEDGETFEEFEKREGEARALSDEISAAVDAKLEADACDERVMTALRDMPIEDAVKALNKSDFVSVAKMKGIDHRGREIDVATRIKEALGGAL